MSVFDNYPEVSFINNATLEGTLKNCKEWYEKRHEELTGEPVELADTDQIKLLLDTMAYMHWQRLCYIDQVGKMNLLKYATGAFLDNLGANVSQPPRDAGKKAHVTMRIVLSKKMEVDYTIPAGTIFSADDDVFFESGRDVIISAGAQTGDVLCFCTEPGTDGNGYKERDISEIVTPLTYVQEVYNLTESSGGEDEESDEAYAESVYLAASKPNTTGNEDGYEYVIRQVSSQIGDIQIQTPTPLHVDIVFLMEDGECPSDELVAAVASAVKNPAKKSLNDYITVNKPKTVDYEIDVNYYINESDRSKVSEIQKAVTEAVDAYTKWQSEKIGRDISPDRLMYYIMATGVKRVVIMSPSATVIESGQVAKCGNKSVQYGGIEDD